MLPQDESTLKDRIAIQGYRASFHEIAARKFFGSDADLMECHSFQGLFDALERDEANLGVMAIENSVAGSILPNYVRMRDSGLKIIGEVYIRIEMNLMALPGQSIDDLKEVHSHPIAILQTAAFFRSHPHITIVESPDTAFSARQIAHENRRNWGALASRAASETYGLEIIAAGVETNKRNFTRFMVLEKDSDQHVKNATKASWSFRTTHEAGSLANVLTILGKHKINLTKIQSLPVLGEEWKYYFHADLEFNDVEQYLTAKEEVVPFLNDLVILGEYPQGEKYL